MQVRRSSNHPPPLEAWSFTALPKAPAGGSGPGYSCSVSLDQSPHREMPHFDSPAARYTDWWSVATDEFMEWLHRQVEAIVTADSWQLLKDAAEAVLGAGSFSLGVCYGIADYFYKLGEGLLELCKILVLAELYERLDMPLTWRSLYGAPGDAALQIVAIGLTKLPGVDRADLRTAHWEREALKDQLQRFIDDPWAEILTGIRQEYETIKEDWARVTALIGRADLVDNFEAGRAYGDLVVRVLMAISAVLPIAGAALIAAKSTFVLVKWAKRVKLVGGGNVAKAGSVAENAAVGTATRRPLPPRESATTREPPLRLSTELTVAQNVGPRIIEGVDARAVSPSHRIWGSSSSKRVDRIADSMERGGYIGRPIKVVENMGKMIIVDGHHRAAAALRTKTPLHVEIVGPDTFPMGKGGWQSIDEIIQASQAAGPNRLRQP